MKSLSLLQPTRTIHFWLLHIGYGSRRLPLALRPSKVVPECRRRGEDDFGLFTYRLWIISGQGLFGEQQLRWSCWTVISLLRHGWLVGCDWPLPALGSQVALEATDTFVEMVWGKQMNHLRVVFIVANISFVLYIFTEIICFVVEKEIISVVLSSNESIVLDSGYSRSILYCLE